MPTNGYKRGGTPTRRTVTKTTNSNTRARVYNPGQ